jgi:hypothetical protein
MSGVDSEDGQGLVLVFGPGCRPGNHFPVPVISDNEFGLIGCKSIRKQPALLTCLDLYISELSLASSPVLF